MKETNITPKISQTNVCDGSEGIDVNKAGEQKKCDICRYWYYLDKGFKFHMDVRNGCYDVLMMSINPNRLLF